MALLIDGYNLIYAASIIGRGVGPGTLERARTALLNFLTESLTEAELRQTAVVFDAKGAPPGKPRYLEHQGIAIHFATGYDSADELIEELIAKDSAPRKLTVVSSDHRVQRAARRRKAKAIDSDKWFYETRTRRAEGTAGVPPPPLKPHHPPTAGEVEFWLDMFAASGEQATEPQSVQADGEEADADSAPPKQPTLEEFFPPQYTEELNKLVDELHNAPVRAEKLPKKKQAKSGRSKRIDSGKKGRRHKRGL